MVSAYNTGADITYEIVLFHLSLLLVQLIFFSIGSLIAATLKNPKSSGSLAAGLLLGSFMIAKVTDLTDRVNFINTLSPFKYFSYADVVNGKGLDMLVVLLSVLLIAACTAGTYYFYRRRDLRV